MKRLRLAVLVLAGSLAGAAPGSSATPPPLVKNVNGWITALAMDGPRVAYATQAYAPTNCDKLFTWNVSTRAAALVSGPKTGNCGSDDPSGQPVQEVAIAGTHLAWLRAIYSNTESDDYLFGATLPKPSEVKLATASRIGDREQGPQQGGWIGGLVGSGTVLAANTWTTGSTGTVTKASLAAVGAKRLTAIASGSGTITAESADTGRIAVVHTDGSVAIFAASGTLLQTITPTSVDEVSMRKDYLVVLTKTKTLEIYNSHTGVLIRTWPAPGAATNLDVNSNIAVFSAGRILYGLQLTTGKQVVLSEPKRAIVGAEIEAPGVVYAYNTVKGIRSIGNLVFLPLAGVQDELS